MVANRYPGKNVSAVKTHNIQAILLNLLFNEPSSRVMLAREISISTTTITKLVDELISQGIIEEQVKSISGRRRVGRPHGELFLVRDSRYALGVHIGGGIFRLGLVNLRNEVVEHKFCHFQFNAPVNDVISEIGEQCNQLIQDSGISRESIIGIGVGAPGLVNYKTGVIGYAKNQGWQNAPVSRWLGEKTGLEVVVENNVRAMALGEAFFGAGRDISSLLFVYGRRGVGAGIIVDNKIYRGTSLGAGEIGHTFVIQDSEDKASFGSVRTLEDLVSAPALVNQAKEVCKNYPEGLLAKYMTGADEITALERFFEAVRDGDDQARNVVEKSARYLGLSLVNAVNLLNPELILLGGIFAQEKDIYIPIVKGIVRDLAFAGLGKNVKIQETSFGWKAGLLGASALALIHFLYLPQDEAEAI
jgi:predicted NBD/HSP70 family sugar kinase/biotin operon repressor